MTLKHGTYNWSAPGAKARRHCVMEANVPGELGSRDWLIAAALLNERAV